jgi:preprotein translocase subunit SecA
VTAKPTSSAVSRVRERVMRFLEKPGTADLTRHRHLLPVIAAREDELRRLPVEALAVLADAATDRAGYCAAAREAARRALGERPYDVQLLGAMVMMSGQVAEMATGEGKTLSVALAAAWYAACGRSVHVMSVNDYLARRDAEWMGPVYELLGITVGYLGQHSSQAERRAAYSAQVTYAAVSEIGFDVLRDRLRPDVADLLLPEPDVVVIDEVDSVLIDEARVPLVLAGAAEAGDADHDMARLVRALRRNVDYEVDEDGRNVHLTERAPSRPNGRSAGSTSTLWLSSGPLPGSTLPCTPKRSCNVMSITLSPMGGSS